MADGSLACRQFNERNERELAAWQKSQPPVPYVYPREGLVLGAPWGSFLDGVSDSGDLILASVLPHVGAQLRAGSPALLLSLPWSLPIGPPMTCSRARGSFTVKNHRPHRALLEPGMTAGQRGVGTFVRPGYRFLYHPSDWVVGIGGGLGSTLEISGNREPTRLSLSPEAVIQFGHCCDAGYFTLQVRYDHFLGGNDRDLIGGSLGFVYF